MIISPTVTLLAVAPLTSITVGNLLDVCQGFTAPTKYSFSRTLPVLRFKEDEDTVVATSPEAVAKAILQNEVILPSLNDGDVASTMGLGLGVLEQEPVLDVLPNKLTSGESLHPISFEDDIEKFLDIAKPYYALGNEYAIVDDETGEMVGFVCTGRVESPVSRESGGTGMAEAGRHMAAAGSVAALLRNPQKKRCVYDFIPCYIPCVFCLLVGLSCLIVLSHHTGVSCFLSWYLSYSGSITLHHSIIGNAIHTREESRKSLPRSTVVISSLQLPTIPSSLRGERVCCMSVCFTCIILGNLSHTTFHLVAYSSPLQVHRLLQAHCHMSYSA